MQVAGEGDVRESTIMLLKEDLRRYDRLREHCAHAQASMRVARSVFKQVVVEQIVAICIIEGWKSTPRIVAWIKDLYEGVMTTQPVEDGFHDQKLMQTCL